MENGECVSQFNSAIIFVIKKQINPQIPLADSSLFIRYSQSTKLHTYFYFIVIIILKIILF